MLHVLGRGLGNAATRASSVSTHTPFSPNSISNLIAWYDGDSDMIQEFDLISSLGNHVDDGVDAVQNTDNLKPIANIRSLNGQPSIDFKGGQMLDVINAGINPANDDFTIIFVAGADVPNWRRAISFGGSELEIGMSPFNRWYAIDNGIGMGVTVIGDVVPDKNAHIIGVRKDSASFDGFFDSPVPYFTRPNQALSSASDIRIGSNEFNNSIDAHMPLILIYDKKLSDAEMALLFDFIAQKYKIADAASEDVNISAAGQSLIEQQFTLSGGSGAANTTNVLGTYFTGNVDFIDGATGGSALLEAYDIGSGHWIKNDGSFGGAYTAWEASVAGQTIDAILWSQGETDAQGLGPIHSSIVDLSDRAAYKDGLIALFTQMRNIVGDVPIFIDPLGRRAFTAYSGFQSIREIQREITNELDYVYIMAGKAHRELSDAVHLTQSAREELGTYHGHYIATTLGRVSATPVNGPRIVDVQRSGANVTITLDHLGNNDFTPSNDADGFVFYEGGYTSQGAPNIIPWVSSPARVNSTTLQGVLSASPSGGDEYLLYQVAAMIGDDPSNYVLDNTALNLPLDSAVWLSLIHI